MVSVPPHGEAVSHASHESSEFEFGGAQPPSPADGQAEDEDATESLSIEELAQWLDGRGILAHISPHAAPRWAELYSTAGAGKPAGVWYAVGGSWIRFCAVDMASWLADSPYVYALGVDRSLLKVLDSDVCTRVFIDTYGAGEGAINWPAFRAIGYTGVEINPYSMTFRDEDWYNAWDVESGVVWEPSALVSCCRVATRRTDGRYVLDPRMPETLRALPCAPPPAPISGGNE